METRNDDSQAGTTKGDADIDDAFLDIANSLSLPDPLPLSEQEAQTLDLYDQLEDLRLTRALLEAQATHEKGNASVQCGW